MDERLKQIEEQTRSMLGEIERASGTAVSTERHPDNPMVKSIPPSQIRLFDVGLFAEAEMLRANEAKAYFAACLAGATMNEALLALMCLMFQEEVEKSRQFQSSKTEKKLRNKSFGEVVSRWQFQQLINIAQELDWIPTAVVSEDIKTTFANAYREMMPQTHPEMTQEEVEVTAISFHGEDAGAAILTFTQEIRNLIHAGRWLRVESGFDASNFSRWCQFAVHVFGEVRVCLMHSLSTKNKVSFETKLREAEAKIGTLPPEWQKKLSQEISKRLTLSGAPQR